MSNEVYDFNIGHSTAYAYAKASGDLPEGMTPEEYGELLASYATVGQTAVTAAQTATTKASEAATSATTATNKASEATTAATTATTKAGEASASASTATSAKDTAVSASQTATSKASEATTAAATATSAKTDAVAANTAAQSAKTAAQTAQTGAETAAASVEASAAQIATNAADISQLKSEFTALDPVIVNQSPEISTENSYDSSMMVYGYWIGQDGVIHALNNNYGYAKIPVLSGREYLLSYNNGTNKPSYHSGEAGGYLIYNANDELVENIIVQDLPDATDDVGYPAKYITIPDGGAYMLITLAFGVQWNAVESFSLNIISLVGGTLKELYGASVDPYTLKWSGKKWVAFGDSLTEVNTRASLHYHDYIKEATGITVVNMGASGTGYKRSENDGKAFYMRILNVPNDTDVVTIFGSGNDLNYAAMGFNSFAEALGTVTDSTTDTICGCINKTIENLYSVLPTVQLALITPCPWQGYNPANVGNSMDLYSQAIVEICKLHGIPCLDLYHCSGLRPWDADYRQLCYSNDDGNGTHPDNNGQKILAPHFNALLESLLI